MAFLSFLAERAATGFGWLDELSKLGGRRDGLPALPAHLFFEFPESPSFCPLMKDPGI